MNVKERERENARGIENRKMKKEEMLICRKCLRGITIKLEVRNENKTDDPFLSFFPLFIASAFLSSFLSSS